MKSWADHSDSEDEGYSFPAAAAKTEEAEEEASKHELEVEEELPKKEFVLPTQPPFTAFAGNLAPTIENAQQIIDAISEMDAKVTVDRVRLMTDRETGKRKGYCYIELPSVDDLRALLSLNGDLSVAGRSLRLDVATSQRSGGGDGRRGGRYNRDNRRGAGSEVDGSKFRGGLHGRNTQVEQRERPTERTKIVIRSAKSDSGAVDNGNAAPRSNIFGGGKPRDESTPSSSLQRSLRSTEEDRNQHLSGPRFNRGDRRGGSGRAGRGGRGHHSGRSKGTDFQRGTHKPESKPMPVAQVSIYSYFQSFEI